MSLTETASCSSIIILPTEGGTVYLEVQSSLIHLTFAQSGYRYKRSACLIQPSVGPLTKLFFFFAGGSVVGLRFLLSYYTVSFLKRETHA